MNGISTGVFGAFLFIFCVSFFICMRTGCCTNICKKKSEIGKKDSSTGSSSSDNDEKVQDKKRKKFG